MSGVSHAALIMAYSKALGRACRFNGSNEYMSRTATASIPSPENRKNTFSIWLRPDSSGAGTFRVLFSADSGPNYGFLAINALNEILYRQDDSTATIDVNAASTFTVDHGVWQHIVVQYDSTQGTAANRIKMFKDGSGGNASGTMPASNAAIFLGVNTWPHYIGRDDGGNFYFGDMALFYWVDGAILSPSNFADTIDGIYQAKEPSPTYNNNGFSISMQAPNDLGNDDDNGRDYALTNIDSSNAVSDGPPVSF